MTNSYTISEILHMAEQIETNGQQFYTLAASAASAARVKQVMLDLAQKELQHRNTFADLRNHLAPQDDIHLFDPDGLVRAYLKSIADSHVFNINNDVARLIASIQSPQSAIRLAMQFEKDSIAYFSAIKQVVKPENKTIVDRLIQEELQHLHELQQALENLS